MFDQRVYGHRGCAVHFACRKRLDQLPRPLMSLDAVEFVESSIDRHKPEHARKRCQEAGVPECLVNIASPGQLVGSKDCDAATPARLLRRSEIRHIASEFSS
jgi:hypothetical protein